MSELYSYPSNDYRFYLAHHGVKGMKWGVRHDREHYKRHDKMTARDTDSSVTKRVKKDYNDLSDQEFYGKYKVSKNRYRKRVNKYGDPYMNSPLAKFAKKKQAKKKTEKTAYDRYNRLSESDKKALIAEGWKVNGVKLTSDNAKTLMSYAATSNEASNGRRVLDIAFRDNPSLTYDKIYKEMKVDLNSEDPDVYRDAETEWLKKHGY